MKITSHELMIASDNHDYSYWITHFRGQFTPQEVRWRFRDAVASCTIETISRTTKVVDWFVKSQQFGNGALSSFHKETWFNICQILGIPVSRDDRRSVSHLLASIECERNHINAILSISGVAEHIKMVILKRCAREIDRARLRARLREPAAQVPEGAPMDWENMEIDSFDWDHPDGL
jgi:hypothetical protein